jgi:hypothetical protein
MKHPDFMGSNIIITMRNYSFFGFIFFLITFLHSSLSAQIIENNLVEEISAFAVLPSNEQPVRLVYDDLNDIFYYNTRFGKIYEVDLNGNSTLRYDVSDLQLDEIYGLDFHNNILYISGVKNLLGDSTWIGYGLAMNTNNNQFSTLIKTDTLYKGNAFQDHRLNVIKVMPNGNELLLHLASRTNSGELQEVVGVTNTNDLREHACTAAFFKIPIQPASTITIQDDETWMNNSNYVFAKGVRHAFALDFHSNGNIYVAGNSDRRHVSEPVFLIEENANLEFPWYQGAALNPLQNVSYDPTLDTLLATSSNNQGYYNTDPNFPQNNSAVAPSVLINTGPDADKWKNEATGQIWDASDLGMTLNGLSGHKSPTGLFWDKDDLLPDTLKGGALITCWTPSNSIYDTGEDLLLMQLLNGNNIRVTRLASGFNRPLAVVMKANDVYVLDKTNIWKMSFSSMPLPVELTKFEVNVFDNCAPQIKWKVASEINFSHYEIEKSWDGIQFQLIQKIDSFEEGKDSYSFEDRQLSVRKGIVYYRLKMVDQDGSFQYSNIKSEYLDCDSYAQDLLLYPTVVQDGLLKIKWSSSFEHGDVYIFDIQGVEVRSLKNISNHSHFEIPNLPIGVYTLKVKNKNDIIGIGRFMIPSN